ncbi:PspA/IM30 family protein [Pajaroellobacter abortibovis]|uniref:Phage shock protein A n=1 Tax=Pajaroellobacter abortibovis TaxID=1882918 RepID=A0A1L6MVF7_9BACT|nr:PspA/IM30 family protein [Pajaroellobacter abortibovis]APR99481.1 hypothetical protein BCY86_01385 [Pajaroellobacter abortibovis]
MGIFSRLVQLIKSNLNDLLSRSEDPEKMLNQIVLEMSTQLIEAKKKVATSIADERRLWKQLEQEKAQVSEWERRAMLALKAGDEGLAKEALARKREHEELANTYQEQHTKQKIAVEQLKKALHVLNDKIEEAKRKKNVLIARKKRADAQRSIQETISGLKEPGAFETFERMATKVEQAEAEAEAQAEISEEYAGDSLAARFTKLEKTTGTDDELIALKRKIGLLPPEEESTETKRSRIESISEQDRKARILAPEANSELTKQDELTATLEELENEKKLQRGHNYS